VALADVIAPEEARPEEIVGAGRAAVPPAPRNGPILALLPPEAPAPAQATQATQAAPQATATTPQATVAAAATNNGKPPSTTPVQAVASLPKSGTSSYFLQLAAYGNEKLARELAAKLAPTYPALVLTPSNQGASIFKVVIGPLNRAESGTLLTWFRYRGFPDAFLKQE
jgi:cell division septation protein DedD